jgi:glycosyltransferase involved in cell wall biosynthesis
MMRIAQIPTLSAPVSEESTGSIEAWTWLLTRELLRLGHDVSVFATGDSTLPAGAKLRATQPGAYGSKGAIDDWQLCEWLNICRAVEHSGEFDVLHSHAYLWGLPLSRVSKSPMFHTTHIVPDDNAAKLWSSYPDAFVTAISQQQWSAYPKLHPMSVIHHGVDPAHFHFHSTPQDYVCYLGRFVSGKGPRQAIAAARQVGVRLLMAGPGGPYFREQVQPLIDGQSVEYVGFVRGEERARLLGGARALLYPIQYPESFGLVLVEAMLCGTPVAAMKVGAVPEILEEGVTGCMAESNDQMAEALVGAMSLDRKQVRIAAELRFSAAQMARRYASLYERIAHRRIAP